MFRAECRFFFRFFVKAAVQSFLRFIQIYDSFFLKKLPDDSMGLRLKTLIYQRLLKIPFFYLLYNFSGVHCFLLNEEGQFP